MRIELGARDAAQCTGIARRDFRRGGADAEVVEPREQEAGGAGRVEGGARKVERGVASEIARNELGSAQQLVRRGPLVARIIARHGHAQRAAVIPFELATQVPVVVGTLARGAVKTGRGKSGKGRRIVGAMIGKRNALEIAVARLDAEAHDRSKTVGDRQINRSARLEQIVATGGDIAAHGKDIARFARDDRDGPADGVATEQRTLRALEHLDPLDIHQVLVRPNRSGEIDAIEINPDAWIDVEGEIVRTDPADIGRQHRR